QSECVARRELPRRARLIIPVADRNVRADGAENGSWISVTAGHERAASPIRERGFEQRSRIDQAEVGLAAWRASRLSRLAHDDATRGAAVARGRRARKQVHPFDQPGMN